jgi:hypothetical protein
VQPEPKPHGHEDVSVEATRRYQHTSGVHSEAVAVHGCSNDSRYFTPTAGQEAIHRCLVRRREHVTSAVDVPLTQLTEREGHS